MNDTIDLTLDDIKKIWAAIPEAADWGDGGDITYARHCIDLPDCYEVGDVRRGAKGEPGCRTPYHHAYAVIDIRERRVLDEDEFPSLWFCEPPPHGKRWRDVPGSVGTEFSGEQIGAGAALQIAQIREQGYKGIVLIGDELARFYVIEISDVVTLRAIMPAGMDEAVPQRAYLLRGLELPERMTPVEVAAAVATALREHRLNFN